MKRIISIAIVVFLLVGTTACSNSQRAKDAENTTANTSESGDISEDNSALPSETEKTPESTDQSGEKTSRILIAYFTWAENTSVADPDSIDVDAVTSASVLIPGNVGLLAQWIAEETKGDRFSIITEESYSSDYDTCLERATDEHDNNARPAIQGSIDNIEDYDIVFLGFPNWWYSCPMAILTFIEKYDLSGKTVIPFCSHGTGGFAASLRDIGKVLPEDCRVLKEFGAYRPEVADSKDELLKWLSELDIAY